MRGLTAIGTGAGTAATATLSICIREPRDSTPAHARRLIAKVASVRAERDRIRSRETSNVIANLVAGGFIYLVVLVVVGLYSRRTGR